MLKARSVLRAKGRKKTSSNRSIRFSARWIAIWTNGK